MAVKLVLGVVVATASFIVAEVAAAAPHGSARGPVASAHAVEDVAQRDQLIADQENLLNAWRCSLGVDVHVVIGGCPNPDTVVPGAAPQDPTADDIEVRDRLIADQEALLKAYRCLFRDDHPIHIPGYCIAPLTTISAGDAHVCGLRFDRTAECWGHDDFGQATPPGGRFTSVSARGDVSCGVLDSGSIKCWGNPGSGQLEAPEGVFTAVSVGSDHGCGIVESGALKCWGSGTLGVAVPAGRFTSVSAGSSGLSCGLRANGTVECWGDGYRQGTGPDTKFTAVEAIGGSGTACGIADDGAVQCWTEGYRAAPMQENVPEGVFSAITADWHHACGLRASGNVECWLVYTWPREQAQSPEGEYTAIAAGSGFACGLRNNGTVDCWRRQQHLG